LADLTFIGSVNIFCKFVGDIVEITVFCHVYWVIISDCAAILAQEKQE